MTRLLDIFLHLDRHLNDYAGQMGAWLYVVLFAIIFVETGLVIMPFLPGDSLLFAVGALSATPGSPINLAVTAVLLTVAAVLGDAVNYSIGKRVGPRVFAGESSVLFNRKHLERAAAFYEKYGGRAIILARFVPVVRTFAPFVAGIGRMSYPRFLAYNVVGAVVWVVGFLVLGWAFGNVPVVKNNFALVTLGIVAVSVLPVVVELINARRRPAGTDGAAA